MSQNLRRRGQGKNQEADNAPERKDEAAAAAGRQGQGNEGKQNRSALPKSKQGFLGFLQLSIFFVIWVGSAFLPLALLGWAGKVLVIDTWWISGTPILQVSWRTIAWAFGPYATWIGWIAVRRVFPPRYWPALHRLATRLADRSWYFRTQQLVFQDVEEGAPPADSKRLFAVSPHGVLCCGWSLALVCSSELLPSNMRYLGTEALFWLPGISDFLTWHGSADVSKKNMFNLMGKNRNVALIPGGFQEATLFERNVHRSYQERAGFLKYSLKFGYKVHPVYIFGEEQTFWAWQGFKRFRLYMNKFKMPGVIFWGMFGFLPFRSADITVVVGKAIDFGDLCSRDPSAADIRKAHKIYLERVQALFDEFKGRYASEGENAQLELIA